MSTIKLSVCSIVLTDIKSLASSCELTYNQLYNSPTTDTKTVGKNPISIIRFSCVCLMLLLHMSSFTCRAVKDTNSDSWLTDGNKHHYPVILLKISICGFVVIPSTDYVMPAISTALTIFLLLLLQFFFVTCIRQPLHQDFFRQTICELNSVAFQTERTALTVNSTCHYLLSALKAVRTFVLCLEKLP